MTPESEHVLKVALRDAEQEAVRVAATLLRARRSVAVQNSLLRDALDRVTALRNDLKIPLGDALRTEEGEPPAYIHEVMSLIRPTEGE